MEMSIENNIEWYRGNDFVCASFSQKKYKTKIEKLAEKYPDLVLIQARNSDGTILVKFPLSWLRINPTKQLSEEQRKAIAERLAKYRRKRTVES